MAEPSKDLNELLEDALDDLLLDDKQEKIKEPELKPNSKSNSKLKSKSKPIPDLEPPSEEEMNKFFEKMTAQLRTDMGPEEAQEKINETVPQIFDLMQNLLSKELLYPALTDLSPKFDAWLKNNSATLSEDDKKRFRQQKVLINKLIKVFDDESLDNQERFNMNLELMEKMQSLGSPPKELTVPEGVANCSIM